MLCAICPQPMPCDRNWRTPWNVTSPVAVLTVPPLSAAWISLGVGFSIPAAARSRMAKSSARVMLPYPIGLVGGVKTAVSPLPARVISEPLRRPLARLSRLALDPAKREKRPSTRST